MSYTSLNGRAQHAEPIYLTKREVAALEWSARGKSSWEISRILGCGESAINFHFCNIRRKFGVKSRHVAVLLALEHNLIDL
ncbi:LuxR family transcriptional regulator [Pseudomonas sp. Marseille-Q5115]|uniref:LuxR family transcriptional regulator n=1 Tax=Pseudomonas sp. Marseille-Q5115 TaxID=2866593 RepID=UPI00298ED9A3|nr:LuxR family transcriptional regulator [Pseudomonas sp. Marseille-Q5115]